MSSEGELCGDESVHNTEWESGNEIKHTPIKFDDLILKYSNLVGLRGKNYNYAVKSLFYSVIANKIKLNFFTLDNIPVDMRIPLLIMMKSGYGKDPMVEFIEKSIGDGCIEPTLTHVYQLIGKVRIIPKKQHEESHTEFIGGYLSSDYLVIDDAYSLLNMELSDSEEILHNMRTALDQINRNKITVGGVDVPLEEKYTYYPSCTISLFTQPITNMDEKLLNRGSFRRFLSIFVDASIDEHTSAIQKCKFNIDISPSIALWVEWSQFLNTLPTSSITWNISKFEPIINAYIQKLMDELKIGDSKEALYYTDSLQFNIKIFLFKMSAIRALVESSTNIINIDSQHIIGAILDYDAIYRTWINWIRRQLNVITDKPNGWNKHHENIISILKKSDGKKSLKDVVNIGVKNGVKQLTMYRIVDNLVKWNYIKKEFISDSNEKQLSLCGNQLS